MLSFSPHEVGILSICHFCKPAGHISQNCEFSLELRTFFAKFNRYLTPQNGTILVVDIRPWNFSSMNK